MNKFNDYLARLQQALNRRYDTLSRSEQDEILAEIESHIAEGRKDPRMGAEEAQKEANLLAELGSPTDMADGLYRTRHSYRWLLFFLIPPAAHFFVDFIGWDIRSIPAALYIPIFISFPIYLLSVLWLYHRQSANRDSRRDKQAKMERSK